MAPCSVCDRTPALHKPHNKLQCDHEFCEDCHQRYIDGSLAELSHAVRCCICGTLTRLTREVKEEVLIGRFGRDLQPSLKDPQGFFLTMSGHYIIVDAYYRRVMIFDAAGVRVTDFAYVHGCEVQNGVVLTDDSHIVLPLRDPKYTSLAYYNLAGKFRGSVFLRPDSQVGGMALASDGSIVVTDGKNRCVYTVGSSRKLTQTRNLQQLPEEHFPPWPHDVATRTNGDVIVTDTANQRVRVYDKNWELINIFGSPGQQPGQFNHPTGVTVDDQDRIVVVDSLNHRVQLFTSTGSFLNFVVRYNEGSDVYMYPVSAVTRKNYSMVLLKGQKDTKAGEIRIYSL